MKKLIQDMIRAWKYKRAVRKADYLRHVTHRKHMVIVVNGRLEVVAKKDIKKFVAGGVFRKGITTADIERKALYITL